MSCLLDVSPDNVFDSPNTVWSTDVCNWHRALTPTLAVGADNGIPDYAMTDCIHWGFPLFASIRYLHFIPPYNQYYCKLPCQPV